MIIVVTASIEQQADRNQVRLGNDVLVLQCLFCGAFILLVVVGKNIEYHSIIFGKSK